MEIIFFLETLLLLRGLIMRYIRRLIIGSYQDLLECFMGYWICERNFHNIGIDDSNISTFHWITPTNEIFWMFVKLWTIFFTNIQLKHIDTSIRICLTVCILAASEDLLPEWFYSQKDFSIVIDMEWKPNKLWVFPDYLSALTVSQRYLENSFLEIR